MIVNVMLCRVWNECTTYLNPKW